MDADGAATNADSMAQQLAAGDQGINAADRYLEYSRNLTNREHD